MKKIEIYPVNRVEGDLELRLEINDNVVTEAYSVGTMFRGFENIMIGRPPLDGLVITPRICGICSTSHLYASALALDMLYQADVPLHAQWVRNITLMVESLQNDIRHAVLLLMPNFVNEYYQTTPFYAETVARFEPLKGSSTRQAIEQTREVLEIIAILGGQWPHSSFMVPGGVTSMPSINELNRCDYLLQIFKGWYERQVLGCRLEEWQSIETESELTAWIDQSRAHADGDLGFFMRVAEAAGLKNIGRAHDNFICYGIPDIDIQENQPPGNADLFNSRGGFYTGNRLKSLVQENISEDLSHSWFRDQTHGLHPYAGKTVPYATGSEDRRYSWAKAPRYMGMPAEAGPLAEMIVSGDPLFLDLIERSGSNALVRQLARWARPAKVIPLIESCIHRAVAEPGTYYRQYDSPAQRRGHGMVEAPRGALGHWIEVVDDKISSYQIITPTTWNGSPRDENGIRGPWEEAIVGTEIKNDDDPLEIQHIVHSFDPCLVCTVHTIEIGEKNHGRSFRC